MFSDAMWLYVLASPSDRRVTYRKPCLLIDRFHKIYAMTASMAPAVPSKFLSQVILGTFLVHAVTGERVLAPGSSLSLWSDVASTSSLSPVTGDSFQINCCKSRLPSISPCCLQLRGTRTSPCVIDTLRAFLFATTLRHFDGNPQ